MMPKQYKHVVQAIMGERWMDCRYCETIEDAEQQAEQMAQETERWMGKPTLEHRRRMVRVWPVEAANCYRMLQRRGNI